MRGERGWGASDAFDGAQQEDWVGGKARHAGEGPRSQKEVHRWEGQRFYAPFIME